MEIKRIRGAISVDTDSLDTIYYAFKNKRVGDRDVTYKKILPRFLEFFKQKNIKATFFIIGSDIKAPHHKSMLRRIAEEGHELANHTFNHYLNFSRLSPDKKEEEIAKCEEVIEKTVGTKPVGFRAPGWDIDSETMKILENRGYLYDSSVYPTYFNIFSLAYLFIKNRGVTHSKSIGHPKNTFAPLVQYHPDLDRIHLRGESRIIELPINATPFFRVPFFGTFLFASKSKRLFDYSLKRIYRSGIPLNYELHTAELYDGENDEVDDRIKNLRHPCISTSFARKEELYHHIFRGFNRYYTTSTIRDLLEGK